MAIKPIECHSLEQHADSLARYLPSGDLFAAKWIDDSKLRQLLLGLSHDLQRRESTIKQIQDEITPDTTQAFLSDWERVLGIPDSCFSGEGTDAERRRDILVKLAALGVQTVEDFQNLANLFGLSVTVYPGVAYNSFPLTFPYTFSTTGGLTAEEARFTIIVEYSTASGTSFPYTFPILFGSEERGILECLFNKLKPANCQVLFIGV